MPACDGNICHLGKDTSGRILDIEGLQKICAYLPSVEAGVPETEEELLLFASDEFRMFCYKVLPCAKRFSHDWTVCPFNHPGEKAKRRDPRIFDYLPIPCSDVKQNKTCPRGNCCSHAHNVFEYWLHPSRYRTQLCQNGAHCRRLVCFFAHKLEELRIPDQNTDLDVTALAKNTSNRDSFAVSASAPVGSMLNTTGQSHIYGASPYNSCQMAGFASSPLDTLQYVPVWHPACGPDSIIPISLPSSQISVSCPEQKQSSYYAHPLSAPLPNSLPLQFNEVQPSEDQWTAYTKQLTHSPDGAFSELAALIGSIALATENTAHRDTWALQLATRLLQSTERPAA